MGVAVVVEADWVVLLAACGYDGEIAFGFFFGDEHAHDRVGGGDCPEFAVEDGEYVAGVGFAWWLAEDWDGHDELGFLERDVVLSMFLYESRTDRRQASRWNRE
jgi:hypothetical protein